MSEKIEKELMHLVAQQIDRGIAAVDMEGRVLFFNPAAQQLFGQTAAEARKGDLCSRLHPLTQAVRGVTVANQELFVSAKGPLVRVAAQPLFNRDNQQIGAVAIFHDISEQRKLAEQLDHNKRHLESIIRLLPSAVILIDQSGSIRSVNPAFTTLFEYTPDELIGKPVSRLFEELPACIKEGHSDESHFKSICWRKSRTTFHADGFFSPMRGATEGCCSLLLLADEEAR